MILVLSRFRVANGMEAAVRDAFVARPRLVDGVLGFLGMETFTDASDASIFHLVTRWADRASYETWHKSEAHHASHAWMPRGLKLDAAHTQVLCLDRIEATTGPTPEERALDGAWLVSSFLDRSARVHAFAADPEGLLLWCNPAAAHALGTTPGSLAGRPIWPLMPEPDVASLRARTVASPRGHRFLLNLLGPAGRPYTLECQLEVHPGGWLLFGEAASFADRAAQESLADAVAELSVLASERARRRKEVEAAHAELECTLAELKRTHWHLRRLQEVLPICMECGRVKTGDAQWDDVARYLKDNSDFLSHGYCPPCADGVRARLRSGDSP